MTLYRADVHEPDREHGHPARKHGHVFRRRRAPVRQRVRGWGVRCLPSSSVLVLCQRRDSESRRARLCYLAEEGPSTVVIALMDIILGACMLVLRHHNVSRSSTSHSASGFHDFLGENVSSSTVLEKDILVVDPRREVSAVAMCCRSPLGRTSTLRQFLLVVSRGGTRMDSPATFFALGFFVVGCASRDGRQ